MKFNIGDKVKITESTLNMRPHPDWIYEIESCSKGLYLLRGANSYGTFTPNQLVKAEDKNIKRAEKKYRVFISDEDVEEWGDYNDVVANSPESASKIAIENMMNNDYYDDILEEQKMMTFVWDRDTKQAFPLVFKFIVGAKMSVYIKTVD